VAFKVRIVCHVEWSRMVQAAPLAAFAATNSDIGVQTCTGAHRARAGAQRRMARDRLFWLAMQRGACPGGK
jgi:hypothetical protein